MSAKELHVPAGPSPIVAMRKPGGPAVPAASELHPLQRAAACLADIGAGRVKTRDLVQILITQAGRSKRASQPRAALRLRVKNFDGRIAIRLKV